MAEHPRTARRRIRLWCQSSPSSSVPMPVWRARSPRPTPRKPGASPGSGGPSCRYRRPRPSSCRPYRGWCVTCFGGVIDRQVQQHDVPGGSFDEGADRGPVPRPDDQIPFRKTVPGPGGPGVATDLLALRVLIGNVRPVLLGRSGCSLRCALGRCLRMRQRGVPRADCFGTVGGDAHDSTADGVGRR